ncbi:MAG: hypothetical protein R2720_10325 [Candidatus Nanopelagicales bacterium]
MTLCVMLHGAGSTAQFMQRTFGQAAGRRGWRFVAPDVRGATMAEMVGIIEECSPGPGDVVGGVSLGSHAAAAFAIEHGWRGRLSLVMPAWTDRPAAVAALTAHTADAIAATSVSEVIAGIEEHAPAGDWILTELRQAWGSMPAEELTNALRVAAAQPAPTAAQLATIRATARVVGLDQDPTHPLAVAERYAKAIPDATLVVLPRDLNGAGPSLLAEALSEGAVARVLDGPHPS